MTRHQIEISFPGQTPDSAGLSAEGLAREIRTEVRDDGVAPDITTARADASAMDFGSILVLVLGTPAVTLLAKAVLEWAKRTNTSAIRLNGILIDHLESKDVAAILKALDRGDDAKG